MALAPFESTVHSNHTSGMTPSAKQMKKAARALLLRIRRLSEISRNADGCCLTGPPPAPLSSAMLIR
ncbi:Uncharacterised protein [Mycobacteroides abscessus subsp. abscessus]|nr:Uncharacterised protein [Mycobacteroides abscessus subsp. abscessus]